MRETSEALMAGIDAKMYTPMRSKSSLRHTDRNGSDTSLSSGCSYSPLPPSVVPDFKTPDLEQFRSPFKDCTIHRNPSKGLAMRYDDSSSELDSPVSATIDVKKTVAFPIPNTPAYYTGTPEPSGRPEVFTLPVNVTMRRRRATRNVSPIVLPELMPEHLMERLEQEPEGDDDDESDGKDESDESDYGEDTWGATEISSARAPTVPLFPSPDLAAYRCIIREEMARCYGAHIVSPASTTDSPASTVSGVSTGGHIASSPAVETTPASSPSTLATAFTGLSAQPRLSPILKLPGQQQEGRLSTVLECTETSYKGSGATVLWAHPEESLITNARQRPLIDGNFSCISPSVAIGHEELDRQSEQPLSDSLLSFMKHERSCRLPWTRVPSFLIAEQDNCRV